MTKFRLTPSSIKEWELAQWGIMGTFIALIVGFGVVIVTLMLKYQMGRYTLSITIITTVALTVISLIYNSDKQFRHIINMSIISFLQLLASNQQWCLYH